MWLLVVAGERQGEVWVDASGSDGAARRVAKTFDAWYRNWLDALVRDLDGFTHWNAEYCASPSVLSQAIEAVEAEGVESNQAVEQLSRFLGNGSISLASYGSPYFDQGAPLDPCQACARMVQRLGLSLDVFGPGSPARQADDQNKQGLIGRLMTKLKK